MRQQPALQRALAAPDARRRRSRRTRARRAARGPRGGGRVVAGEHQQLLHAAARGVVEQGLDLVGRVQVRLMRRERAVLAVADARPRERQRDVAGERDPAAHAAVDDTPVAIMWARDASRGPPRACSCSLAGCGTTGSDRPARTRRCCSTSRPTPSTPGIYLASERGYDEAEGVDLEDPGARASTDALKLLQAGRVDIAILDIHDLGLARERGARPGRRDGARAAAAGRGARAAGASARRATSRASGPASPGCRRTSRCCARSSRAPAGTRTRCATTTIGFDAVKAMLANRVAGATAFWNVEGVALKERAAGTHEFRVDDYGAPRLSRARPVRDPRRRSRSDARACAPRVAASSAVTSEPRSTPRARSAR